MGLNLTSYDPADIKSSLIAYMKTKPNFADFDYEGGAINTIIDLLVRNTNFIAQMANMTATESFLDSALLRSNVVSHAQKLSYIPKSRTASSVVVDITVTPASPATDSSIVCEKGSVFINTIGNIHYTFTNTNSAVLVRGVDGKFVARGVELKQGYLQKQRFLYSLNTKKIEVLNTDIDTSTLRVFVMSSSFGSSQTEYSKVDDVTELSSNSPVFFLTENTNGFYNIEFGKNVIGMEPEIDSTVEIEYISVAKDHANGISSLIAASSIEGYSNITVEVATNGYGGAEKNDVDYIKFIAPKVYAAQNRAVREEDYAAIMMKEFPFIKSAIAWGGERNVPKYYGRVFLCAIPKDGFTIAKPVKDIIEKRLRQFAVATIASEVVDAKYLGLRLSIGVVFNANATTDTFTQTLNKIRDIAIKYNDDFLMTFEFWYNNSQLSSIIKEQLPAVTSLEINKVAFDTSTIKTNQNSNYTIQFLNSIVKGSVLVSNVVFDINATEQKIYDDGMGVLVRSIKKNGVVTTQNIGKVNYETGHVSFDAVLLNTGSIETTMVPTTDNFYTDRNYVVFIDNSDIYRITDKKV